MYVRCEKCIQFSDGIPEWKRPLGRPLHRWKIALKLDLTSVSATLLASAATVKWHRVPVFVVLFYFCIVFGEYQ
jgi:hypothetical protein